MNNLDKLLIGSTIAGLGGLGAVILDRKGDNSEAYVPVEISEELRQDGIAKAKEELNGKERIEENNFVIRVRAHNCIGAALNDCSSNLKKAATEGLEQCTTNEYKLDSADLKCIQNEQRQMALKACAQQAKTNQ